MEFSETTHLPLVRFWVCAPSHDPSFVLLVYIHLSTFARPHPPIHIHPPISQFNQCLFVLDTQICHLDIKSLHGFGHWLHQHWIHCQTEKNEALNKLQDLDLDEDMLHAEWKAQIVHPTRPSPHKITLLLLSY
ncbi:hypothetical protein AZE42_13260 [Rhizopogon vesiculosus]|uniref:Uncharacterized protein n=1 Tax=Rhizopogon vesiculosus TaxID=180088 RepID=A0A1J8PY43_9AGAM|nr:hypothetical protein AZE42_13260 [Rhizopogon vesiculosus]